MSPSCSISAYLESSLEPFLSAPGQSDTAAILKLNMQGRQVQPVEAKQSTRNGRLNERLMHVPKSTESVTVRVLTCAISLVILTTQAARFHSSKVLVRDRLPRLGEGM